MDSIGLEAGATSLPGIILYPTTLLLTVLIALVLLRQRRMIVRYTAFAPWVRYMASFYHQYTFLPLAAGLSTNALISSSMFAVGLLFVRRKHLLLKLLMPVYLMIFIVLLSGLANHDYGGTLDIVVKFGYMIVVSLAVFESLGMIGERRVSKLLFWVFLTPLLFQVLSIGLNVKKFSEEDNSTTYIGGYSHEAAFSMILATCLVVATFATEVRRSTRNAMFLICLIGILFANYRTTILAIAPIVLVQFNAELLAPFKRSHRPFVIIGTVVISAMAFAAAAWILRDRFETLAQAFQPWDRLLKPPYEFTEDDKQLLSARGYIWSQYVYAYATGSRLHHLLGFGANSWQGVFDVYAHNTLISSLYEYGPFGVFAMVLMWGTMLMAAMRARQGPRISLIAAHLSFIILNMATMPHWNIEGDILYGVICGYTFHWRLRSAEATAPELQARTVPPSARSTA